jgi:hypothetical protein
MTQHTSGPWIYSGLNNEGKISATIFSGENGELVGTITTTKANARLISAAPELLQIAKDYVMFCQLHDLEGAVLDSALAAIAKAEGK